MNLKIDKKYIENGPKILKAMKSETFLQGIGSTIDAVVKEWNVKSWGSWYNTSPPNIELTPYWRSGTLTMNLTAQVDDYDKLMNNPNTVISDIEWIQCNFKRINVLMPLEVECHINFCFRQALPEEDLGILRMLGKVKKEKPTFYEGDELVICTF